MPTADSVNAAMPLPESLQVPFQQWRQQKDEPSLHALIAALLETLEVQSFPEVYAQKGEQTVIMDDLGVDSLTLAELLFYTEQMLGIRIPNEEVVKLRTVADLKAYLNERVHELPGA